MDTQPSQPQSNMPASAPVPEFEWDTPQPKPRATLSLHNVRWTYVLLGIIVLVYGVACTMSHSFEPNARALYDLGAKYNPSIRAGEWWRLFAPIFLYPGIFFLAINGYSLFAMQDIEKLYGQRRYLAIFFLSGVAGNVFSFGLDRHMSVAASAAAIFGLLGTRAAYHASLYRLNRMSSSAVRGVLINIALVIGLNVFIPNVDIAALLGGLVVGTTLGYVMRPQYVPLSATDGSVTIVDNSTFQNYGKYAALVVTGLFGLLVLFIATPSLATMFGR